MSRHVPGGPGGGEARLEPAGFVVLRTALVPFAEGPAGERPRALPDTGDDASAVDSALGEDRASGRARLRALLERPEAMEALRVAGFDAEAGIARWLEDPDSRRGRKLERTLVLYGLRMAGRPVPFGLFAGTSIGAVGPRTRLVVGPRDAAERCSALNPRALDAVVAAALGSAEVRPGMRVRTAPSAWRAAGTVRWLRRGEDGETAQVIAERRPLAACLDGAEDGASVAELTSALERAGHADASRARAYVESLVDRGLLLPEVVPGSLGEPLGELEQADGVRGTKVGRHVADLRESLERLDAGGLATPAGARAAFEQRVAALAPSLRLDGKLVSANLIVPAADVTVGKDVVAEVRRGMEALARWAPSREVPLHAYREAVAARHGSEWTPLLETLDPELGAGPEVVWRTPPPSDWDPRDSLLLRHVMAAAHAQAYEIDLDALEQPDPPPGKKVGVDPLPDALVTVVADSKAALDAGRFLLHLHGTSGPPAGRLAARAAAYDPAIAAGLMELAERERQLAPDAIHAELSAVPSSDIAAILRRPLLHDWVIDLDGSAPADARRIPISDLLVAVRGGQVVLRSRRHGRPVIPHLTTALALDLPTLPAALRLLGMVGRQQRGSTEWNWEPLDAAPFLPRVRVGRAILARARWRLDAAEVAELRAVGRGSELVRAMRRLRKRRGLPRRVALLRLEQSLPLDLEDALCLDVLGRLLREHEKHAELEELVPGQGELVARCPDGGVVHELLVPFVSAAGATSPAAAVSDPVAVSTPADRRYPPGSEWLDLRAYCGRTVADRLLTEVVGPACRELVAAGDAAEWFFVRYAEDAHHHLRVRVHGDAAALEARAWTALRAALRPALESGRVWRLALDTYDRELERYGGPSAVHTAERLFHADSEAAVDALRLQRAAGADGEARWRLALAGVALLLEDLGLDRTARLAALEEVRDNMAPEILGKRPLARYASSFRRRRVELEELLAAAREGRPDALPGLAPLLEARPLVRSLGEVLIDRSTTPRDDLAQSLAHMRVNRLLPLQARLEPELRIYDALARLEASARARDRRGEA